IGIARGLVVTVAALWLAGCSTSNNFSTGVSNLFGSRPPSDEASAAQANAETSEPEKPIDETTTGTVPPPLGGRPTAPGLLGSDPYDELSLGKKYYRSNNYGIAEKHFRRAVESHPRDAEAWLGLAASYDRLRRFDLADRAYGQAVGILGPTAEILNNQGYSYMLRGDYKRAHAALVAAQRKDPTNKYVQNNLRLLEESYRQGKAIQ
ncbi:MAG: tetratricopeptide repeat protein, partial [Pseudolabrys sp.]